MKPLWVCPHCGRSFANRTQSHSCGRYDLEWHLTGKSPEVVAMFWRFAELVRANGPVEIIAEKSRIAFHVRMSFSAVSLKSHWMDGHVVLARRLDEPRFTRIETFSPRNHLHEFRIKSLEELDARVEAWLKEAYAVGCQKHLR